MVDYFNGTVQLFFWKRTNIHADSHTHHTTAGSGAAEHTHHRNPAGLRARDPQPRPGSG